MTSIELLKEIESWLSFNTEPSKEETANLRKSIKEHLTEQLRIHDVVGQSKQLVCDCVKCKPFHNESAGYRKHKICVKNKAN